MRPIHFPIGLNSAVKPHFAGTRPKPLNSLRKFTRTVLQVITCGKRTIKKMRAGKEEHVPCEFGDTLQLASNSFPETTLRAKVSVKMTLAPRRRGKSLQRKTLLTE
jgi:hypothetical protein